VKEKTILNIQQSIQQIVPNYEFSITNVHPNKKKDIIDVSFSESTNVDNLFSELDKYCKTKPQNKFVSKILLPATQVRFSILETIGKCYQKVHKTKNWNVQFDKSRKLYLVISEKGEETKKFKFTDAIIAFGCYCQSNNFQEAKSLCSKYGLKGNNLLQFVVIF